MKKIMLPICLLSCLTVSAFAAQCPSASDFIHVKGQPWRLSQNAMSQGWDLSEEQSDEAINSNLTTLPGESPLYITMTSTGFTGCAYYLTASYYDTLNVMHNKFADLKSLSIPPFYNRGEEDGYTCEVTAATSSVCQWKWAA